MSSDRVLRSRSVGAPSRLPRATGGQIPNNFKKGDKAGNIISAVKPKVKPNTPIIPQDNGSSTKQHSPSRLIKRKEIDEQYLEIMEKKHKVLKLLTDAAGPHEDIGTPNGREYTYRIAKLSNAINCDISTAIGLEESIEQAFE